jgi:hypothetical protein
MGIKPTRAIFKNQLHAFSDRQTSVSRNCHPNKNYTQKPKLPNEKKITCRMATAHRYGLSLIIEL